MTFFTKQNVKRVVAAVLAVVLANLLAQACNAGASAATAKTTITKLSLTDSGKPRITIVTVGKSKIIIAPPKSDGEPVIQPKGTKTYTLPAIKPGAKVTWSIRVIGVKTGKEKAKATFTWNRPELMAQVVYATSKGADVKDANVKCPKGTNRIRVWTLSPGKSGTIVDPGFLVVRMANNKDVIVDDPSHVGRTWEFYQFNNGKIATKDWSTHYTYPVMATEKAQPRLELSYSSCSE